MLRSRRSLPSLRSYSCVAASASTALAQAVSVQGRVLDPSGQPVPGAAVSLRSASGLVRQAPSRADGSYVFGGVPPGSYDLGAAAEGFRAEPVRVTVGATDTLDADIRLTLAALTDAVVVSASYVELRQSESTTGVTALSRRDIEDRQFTMVADALRLAPGHERGPVRRARQRDVGLPARRRVRLHARDGRRREAQQLRRRLRLRPSQHVRPQPDRGGPRAAERRVRLRRDWRRRPVAVQGRRPPLCVRPPGNGVVRDKPPGGGLVGIDGCD